MKFIRVILKVFFVFIFVIGAFVTLMVGLDWYYREPLEAYCKNIAADATPIEVWNDAKENSFFVFSFQESDDRIAILNHKSFIFRYQCEVKFEKGLYASYSFISAD
ncbi:hypothetical protein [Gynuella sp.]|uniref:hypothetical protein n=1 Tax=Gynuella sp. TaxID=2969146 RepID=UPI003D0EA60C